MSRIGIAAGVLLVLALAIAVACAGASDDSGAEREYDAFRLPWSANETWFLVGGPHCDSQADVCPSGHTRYALDFAPRAPLTGFLCDPSENDPFLVTAAAPGIVRVADRSLVEIEHEDGMRTGYYHIQSSSMTVRPGDQVEAGAPVGNPSCEHRRGGAVPGPHVHFYFCRTDEPDTACLDDRATLLPVVGRTLSGWQVAAAERNYDGSLVRGGDVRTAANLACSGEESDATCADLRNDLDHK